MVPSHLPRSASSVPVPKLAAFLVLLASMVPAESAPVPAVPADCDYLIITDLLLLPQARRLADLRAVLPSDLARKPHIVTMADIYGAYPALSPRYRSLPAFLKEVRGQGRRAPVSGVPSSRSPSC